MDFSKSSRTLLPVSLPLAPQIILGRAWISCFKLEATESTTPSSVRSAMEICLDSVLESGGMVILSTERSLLTYWPAPEHSETQFKDLMQAIKNAESEIERLKASNEPSLFRELSLGVSVVLHDSGSMALSNGETISSGAELSRKTRIAVEMASRNRFLGATVLLDQSASTLACAWFEVETAGKALLTPGGKPTLLFKVGIPLTSRRQPQVRVSSRLRKSGEITIQKDTESLDSVIVRAPNVA